MRNRQRPQGRELSRSSFDIAAKWPLPQEQAELLFTFTDVFNEFAPQREVDGEAFRALYRTCSRRKSLQSACVCGLKGFTKRQKPVHCGLSCAVLAGWCRSWWDRMRDRATSGP